MASAARPFLGVMNNKIECLKRFNLADALLIAAISGDGELVSAIGAEQKNWPDNSKYRIIMHTLFR